MSTLLAPLLTPLLVLALAGQVLPVDAGGMFVSIVQIVLAPVILGPLLRHFLPGVVETLLDIMPLVSVLAIPLQWGGPWSRPARTPSTRSASSSPQLWCSTTRSGGLPATASRGCWGMDEASKRAVSIEVGMQNSGLAAALATVHFNPAAAVPGAIFSVWHNVSGSLLAPYWGSRPGAATPTRSTGATTGR